MRLRGAARSRRLRGLSIGGGVFLAAVLLAGWVGEVSLPRLLRGLPLALDYIARTMPVLRWDSLGADLAEWMWGLPDWLAIARRSLTM